MTSDINARKVDHPQSGVYAITCKPSGKVYCGSSSQMQTRYRFHLWQLRKGIHINKELQADYRRYGELAFEFTVVALEANRYKRNRLEWNYIAELKKHGNAYNVQHFPDYPVSKKTQALRQKKERRSIVSEYRMPYFLMHF